MPNRDDEIIVADQMQTPRLVAKLPCFCSCFSDLFSIFLKSLKIFFWESPKLFLCIYVFTCLPISLLLTAQSLSSRSLKADIAHLEWLARAVEIWVEADHVLDESRTDLRSLLRLKALYGIPICLLSLVSLIAAVSVAAHKRRPSLKTVAGAVRAGWAWPTLTLAVNYAASIAWAIFVFMVTMATTAAAAGFRSAAVVVLGAGEVYLMAVLSLALVVSVAEKRGGVEAVRAGWGLMRGKRLAGWALSGLVLVSSACIGREMQGVMDGGDWGMSGEYGIEWTVRMKYGYMVGLVIMLGWVVLWSYVVFTVFYFDCKKKLANYASNNISRELEEF